MKTIVVASKNPVKARATLGGFQTMFPQETFDLKTVTVSSGVSHQPMSSAETLTGAINRAHQAQQLIWDADYWVGLEGGIEETQEGMMSFAWIVVMSEQLTGKGRTGTFFLPEAVANLIRQGQELGVANDLVFNRTNSKHGEGAVGILTRGVINRTQLYEHAVILALAPFRNINMYLKEGIS